MLRWRNDMECLLRMSMKVHVSGASFMNKSTSPLLGLSSESQVDYLVIVFILIGDYQNLNVFLFFIFFCHLYIMILIQRHLPTYLIGRRTTDIILIHHRFKLLFEMHPAR